MEEGGQGRGYPAHARGEADQGFWRELGLASLSGILELGNRQRGLNTPPIPSTAAVLALGTKVPTHPGAPGR